MTEKGVPAKARKYILNMKESKRKTACSSIKITKTLLAATKWVSGYCKITSIGTWTVDQNVFY